MIRKEGKLIPKEGKSGTINSTLREVIFYGCWHTDLMSIDRRGKLSIDKEVFLVHSPNQTSLNIHQSEE